WRLVVLRDYVWLAIHSEKPDLLDAARRRVDLLLDGAHYRPEFLSLFVERARLQAARQFYDQAGRTLDEYLARADRTGPAPQFGSPRTADERLGEGPPDNVPALFFLEACLLRGFLWELEKRPAEAQRVWAAGFEAVRHKRVGAYYEAAVLGSLSQRLEASDAI